MVDFTNVLNKKADDLKKPVPRPAGTYLCQIVGLPGQKEVTPKGGGENMPVVSYTVRPISALEDVDTDELRSQPPISDWGNFQRTIDFFLHTESGQYYHSKFLEDTLGIETGSKTVGERMAESPGAMLHVKIKHAPYVSRSGEPEIGIEIESTAKA